MAILTQNYFRARADRPGNFAAVPSSSSMRRSWLYLATRSVRDIEPVLIWPALVATARSAMNVSSLSPDRWEMTIPYDALRAMLMASSVWVSVPIWLTLIRIALA